MICPDHVEMLFLPVIQSILESYTTDLSSTGKKNISTVLDRSIYDLYSDLSSTGKKNISTSTRQITRRLYRLSITGKKNIST